MKKHTTQLDSATRAAETDPQLFDNWFDPIEFGLRSRVREFVETMMEEELDGCCPDLAMGVLRRARARKQARQRGRPVIVMATVRARFRERSAR